MRRSRKPLCVVKAYRGFESLPLRLLSRIGGSHCRLAGVYTRRSYRLLLAWFGVAHALRRLLEVIPVRRGLVAGVVAAALALFAGASTAVASTAKNLATVNFGGDSYQNYDFNSRNVAANNVDWPVDLVI